MSVSFIAPFTAFLLFVAGSLAHAALLPLSEAAGVDPQANHAPGAALLGPLAPPPAAVPFSSADGDARRRRYDVYRPDVARIDIDIDMDEHGYALTGGEETWVFGDRDVVIDLGLGRPSARGSAAFDALGLPLGQVHSLNFFFAERYSGRELKIFATLSFEPPSLRAPLPAALPRSCWALKFSASTYRRGGMKAPARLTSDILATPAGLEPATIGLEGRCSIQLSYGAGSCGRARRPTVQAYRSFLYGGPSGSTACADGRKSCPHRLWGALGACDPRRRDTAARATPRS